MKNIRIIALLLLLICQQMVANSNATKLYRSNVLSSTLFTRIVQDDMGFIWIATEYGLNRFDGYNFRAYYNQPSVRGALADDHIHNLIHTADDRLWICSSRLQLYNPMDDNFINVDAPEGKVAIADVAEGPDSTLCAVSFEGALYHIDRKTMTLQPWKELNALTIGMRCLFIRFDEDGRTLWVGGQSGLARIDTKQRTVKRYGRAELGHEQVSHALIDDTHTLYICTPANVTRYNRATDRFESIVFGHASGFKSIRSVVQGPSGSLLVGTFGVGAYSYTPARGEQGVKHLDIVFNRYDLSNVNVSTLFSDRDGNLWVGCFQKGLALIPKEQHSFFEVDNSSLSFDNHYPLSLMEDAGNGELWLGQGNNGLHLISMDGKLRKSYLPYTTPISMHRDAQGDLWVGLYDEGVGCLDTKTGDFRRLPEFPHKRVRAIDEDPQGNLYFAMFNHGIYSFNPKTGQRNVLPKEVDDRQVMTLFVDSNGLLWIGSYEGVKCYDTRQKKVVALPPNGPVGALVNNFAEDAQAHLWIATSDGLYRYDCTTHSYTCINKENGLPDDMVCNVEVAPDGTLWLSTYKCLIHYNEQQQQLATYRKGDGLTGIAFVRSVGTSTAQGDMAFAYDDGYIHFNPMKIEESVALSPLHLSDIRLPFARLENAADSLRLSVYGVETRHQLHLDYDENVVLLRFLSHEHISNDNVLLEYRIANKDNARWNACNEGDNGVQLGPLAPGHYDLEVRATVNGVSSPSRHYEIIVNHPWYTSWWMRWIYFLIALGFVYQFFMGYNNYQKRLRNEERIRFFIDLTHELRQPTTLMLAPLQDLLRRPLDEETGRTLRGIYRNGNRLLQLLNQILDVRKIDKGKMLIQCSETEIVEYVHEIYHVFTYEATKRHIDFRFESAEEAMMLYIDRVHFDKVIYNLLSNAFKFVPNGGEVAVSLKRITTDRGEQVEIQVADNGRGIDKDQVDRVFERFYQAPANRADGRVGFGIGLNLCYNIVKMHHGTISVSNRDDGSTGAIFTITIPTGSAHLSETELLKGKSYVTSADPVKVLKPLPVVAEEEPKSSNSSRRQHTVLVADDDPELLDYLKRSLSSKYRVLTCADGAEALNLTIERVPDLVISDISMPKVDGFSLLTRLKNNNVTSHIPIILLTSLSEHERKIEGLQKGADAYLEKPFDMTELLVRVQGLISTRTKLRGKFTGDQDQQGKVINVEIQGANDKLMESVMKVINEHFSDPDLNVEFLAEKVGLSRTQLHRRIKEITGISCGDFIRNFRMQQAARLLKEGDIYVSQICYAVGYSNPTHFSTSFKRHYGVTPSEYVAALQQH